MTVASLGIKAIYQSVSLVYFLLCCFKGCQRKKESENPIQALLEKNKILLWRQLMFLAVPQRYTFDSVDC